MRIAGIGITLTTSHFSHAPSSSQLQLANVARAFSPITRRRTTPHFSTEMVFVGIFAGLVQLRANTYIKRGDLHQHGDTCTPRRTSTGTHVQKAKCSCWNRRGPSQFVLLLTPCESNNTKRNARRQRRGAVNALLLLYRKQPKTLF